MRRKLWWIVASALAALALAGTAAFASSGASVSTIGSWGRGWVRVPASSGSSGSSSTVQFLTKTAAGSFIDADGSHSPTLGDAFVFTEKIRDVNSHAFIGRDDAQCVLYVVGGRFRSERCDATFTLFGRGSLTLTGVIWGGSAELAITGGTGDFDGAGGHAQIQNLPKNYTQFTMFLT